MTITTSVTNTGLATTPIQVPIGASVTINPPPSGRAYVEYSTANQQAIDNGSAVWNRWPKGFVFVQTSDIPNVLCFAKLISNIPGASMTIDTSPSTDPNDPFNQFIIPVTGQVVQMIDDTRSGKTMFMHTGTISALTLNLPSIANCKANQYRFLYFDKAVSNLSFTGGTVKNAPTSASAGDMIRIDFIPSAPPANPTDLWAKQI